MACVLRKSHWAWCHFWAFQQQYRKQPLVRCIGHDVIFERFNNWRATACKWLVIGHDAFFERVDSSYAIFQRLPIPKQIIGFIFQSFSPRYLLVNFGADILQNTLRLTLRSSEILGWKTCFLLQFSALRNSFSVHFWWFCLHLAPFCLSILLPACFFKAPKTVFLPLKHHFLGCILPFSAMFLMVLRGFVYTITAYFYAFRFAFTSILPCVLHQNALHLAPKLTTFSTKTHSI